MNICFVTSNSLCEYHGGVEAVTVQLMRQFLLDEHRVIHIYSNKLSNSTSPIGLEQRKEYVLPNENVNSFENIIFVADVLKQNNIEIVMNETYVSTYHKLLFQVKQYYPFKLVYSFHGDPLSPIKSLIDDIETISLKYKNYNKIYKFIYSLVKFPIGVLFRYKDIYLKHKTYADECDACVYLSNGYKELVSKILFHKYNNLYSISNPFKFILQRTTKKQNQVIFVGRLVFQKRLDRLLKAWKYVIKEIPDANLVVVGDGDAADSYKAYTQRLGLNNILFIGAQPSLPIISESEILCMPSTHEGLGLVVLEAMNSQTVPFIFDTITPLKEYIQNGENGFIIPSFSIKELAKKIVGLLQDRQELNRIQENLRLSKYNVVQDIAGEWYKLYKSLLKTR
jgi:glycosyltransferase involved in cell wall biosynthesis